MNKIKTLHQTIKTYKGQHRPIKRVAPVVRAVFLDRDGTINENRQGYIHKAEHFSFLPSAIKALQTLTKTDYKIIIITNQSGIGRGFFSEKQFHALNSWFLTECKKKNIRVDKVYYCPHHPDDKCVCRKPAIGMLLQAVNDFDINLNDSWMVGDQPSDVILGREANVKTIKIGDRMPKESGLEPNIYASDLHQAVSFIVSETK